MITQIMLVDPDGAETLHAVRWGLRPFQAQIDGRDFIQAGVGSDGIWRYRTRTPRVESRVIVTLERLNHQRQSQTVAPPLPETITVEGICYRLTSICGDDTHPRYREES